MLNREIFILLLLTAGVLAGDKCKALILSGGANKGAYEVGAVHEWAHDSFELVESMNYTVISGISAGSINSLGFALFPPGHEKAMTDFMMKYYSKTTTD